jgi:hypothetical protein
MFAKKWRKNARKQYDMRGYTAVVVRETPFSQYAEIYLNPSLKDETPYILAQLPYIKTKVIYHRP